MEVRKYTAQVKIVDGPERPGPGWIKVTCPDFIGTDEVLPDWIEPLFDWGWFYVPDIDEMVQIEVLYATGRDDTYGQSSVYNPQIRWRGKRFWGGEETDAPRPVPDDFVGAHYGKLRGFATPNGHLILFDDTEADPSITVRWHREVGGVDKFASLTFDKDGKVKLVNQDETEVHLDGKKADITCDECNVIAATKVTLGSGANEAVIKGNKWQLLHDGHTHPTGMGPSGPPTPGTPIPSADCLSTKVTTE